MMNALASYRVVAQSQVEGGYLKNKQLWKWKSEPISVFLAEINKLMMLKRLYNVSGKSIVSGQMAFHQNVKEGNQATTSCRIQN